MDREHPIPQEVSTYEFRLVGDMTIKQFVQVAAGALISLVLYSSQMEPYVKWPLIIISFLSGVALAFFPIEDRPLSKWIVLFMKAIYSPTIYVWDARARKTEYFQPEPDSTLVSKVTPTGVSVNTPSIVQSQGASQLPETQTDSGSQKPPLSVSVVGTGKLDRSEAEFLSKVDSHFVSHVKPASQMVPDKIIDEKVKNIMQADKNKVEVPKTAAPMVESNDKTQPQVNRQPSSQSVVGSQVTPLASSHNITNIQAATFSPEAAPPSPPTTANVIVGQVMTTEGNIVDGAILEIKDENGRSVRALRTNRLGHFMIVTPLANGKYQITIEKDGYKFEPVSVEAVDRVIPPIAITGKEIDSNNQITNKDKD